MYLICGYVLTTVRETLATAPGVQSVRTVALRRMESDAYGHPLAECVLAARFTRASLDGIQWHSADAVQIIDDAATETLLQRRGAAKDVVALDLKTEPELAALLEHVDLSAMAE